MINKWVNDCALSVYMEIIVFLWRAHNNKSGWFMHVSRRARARAHARTKIKRCVESDRVNNIDVESGIANSE